MVLSAGKQPREGARVLVGGVAVWAAPPARFVYRVACPGALTRATHAFVVR